LGIFAGPLVATGMAGYYELSNNDSAQRPVLNQWLAVAMQLAKPD